MTGPGDARVLVDSVQPDGQPRVRRRGGDPGQDRDRLRLPHRLGAERRAAPTSRTSRSTTGRPTSISGPSGSPVARRPTGASAPMASRRTSATSARPSPEGLFVCQDNGNTAPAPGNQNFKLTRLDPASWQGEPAVTDVMNRPEHSTPARLARRQARAALRRHPGAQWTGAGAARLPDRRRAAVRHDHDVQDAHAASRRGPPVPAQGHPLLRQVLRPGRAVVPRTLPAGRHEPAPWAWAPPDHR